jgi:hypothetical protein
MVLCLTSSPPDNRQSVHKATPGPSVMILPSRPGGVYNQPLLHVGKPRLRETKWQRSRSLVLLPAATVIGRLWKGREVTFLRRVAAQAEWM